MTGALLPPDRLTAILAFVQDAERLKDTLRSGATSGGRRESVAEHSWRLCLLVCLLERELADVDLLRLLQLCLVHDLGEAISGDVPAPLQNAGDDRHERERADMAHLCAVLPEDLRHRMMALWEEYADGATPEAALAKGLDKIETMLQHLAGRQPADFDYAFNLTYGMRWTDRHPALRQLRAQVDVATRAAMREQADHGDRGLVVAQADASRSGSWFGCLSRWLGGRHVSAHSTSQEKAWRRDPLSHPEISRMTQRELSDVWFDPKRIDPE